MKTSESQSVAEPVSVTSLKKDDSNEHLSALMKSLAAPIHLKIYDYFLAIRSYEQDRRIDPLRQKLRTLPWCEYSDEDLDEFSEQVSFDMEELPEKIRCSYRLLNLLWHDMMDFGGATIEKRRFSLNNDDIVLWRLELSNDGDRLGVLYDMASFTKVAYICRMFERDDYVNRMDTLLMEEVRECKESWGEDGYPDDAQDELVEEFEQLNEQLSAVRETVSS